MGSSRSHSAVDTLGPAFAIALFLSFAFVPVTQAEPPNAAPEVGSLTSSHQKLFPTQSADIRCAALDPDGDVLSYRWSTSGGVLEPRAENTRWTAPERPGSYSILAEVEDGRGGYDAGILVIEVVRNEPPVVDSMTAVPDSVLPGAEVRVTCTASDPDGHALGYDWSSTGGQTAGIGPAVTWTAPATPGLYEVSVSAYDGLGGDDSASVDVTVASPEPPVIESLIVRPFAPEYTKEYDWGYRLLRGRRCECEIECVASAGEKELIYEWSASLGTIEGQGSSVLFVPPNRTTEATVTVTVKDAFGFSASRDVLFKVFLREAFIEDREEVPGGCNCGH